MNFIKIVVPYVSGYLLAPVKEALENYPVEYKEIKNKEFGYSKLLKELWSEPLILIEHDVVPTEENIESLIECPNDWCAHNYYECDYKTHLEVVPPFGCVKFSETFIESLKDIWDKPLGWRELDSHLQKEAEARGFENCFHTPFVKHLNPRIA